MDAKDLIDQWPAGSVEFRLCRRTDGTWSAALHTYGISDRSAIVTAESADAAVAKLKTHITPAAPAPTDFDDLI